MAVSLEVLFHFRFGERYWPWIVASVGLFFGYLQLIRATCGEATLLDQTFLWGLVVLGSWHVVAMAVRWIVGGEIHSHAPGTPWWSWSELGLRDLIVLRYVEPVLAFGIGVLLTTRDPVLALWLKAASGALFVKGQLARHMIRSRILDSIDSRIEGKQVNAGVVERAQPSKRTGSTGFSEVRSCEDESHLNASPEELEREIERLRPKKQGYP